MRSKTLLLGFLALAASTCADGPTSPPSPPEVEVLTSLQWSGSVVEIRSQSFAEAPDVRVAFASDTVAAVPTLDPEVRSFVLPPLQSGPYEADVLVDREVASIEGQAVGVAREPTFVAGSSLGRQLFSVQRTGTGSILLSDENGRDFGPDEIAGYGRIDLVAGTRVTRIPELAAVDPLDVEFSVPGPSYRSNHFVFDLSEPGVSDVRVWRTRPDVAPVEPLSCGYAEETYPYTVAEVEDGICLELRRHEVWRNGSELMATEFGFAFGHAQFRMAPGGAWTVVLTSSLSERDPVEAWPVFDDQGEVAYELTRYHAVTGAAFSTELSTMWITARMRDGRWRLDALDAPTGEVLQSLTFEDDRYFLLFDVLQDPVADRLYVVSARSRTDRPVLHHVDASTLELIRSVPVPDYGSCRWAGVRGTLDSGGSDDRVHFLTNAGSDCGWLLWSFDRM